jgi:hypothetical protein
MNRELERRLRSADPLLDQTVDKASDQEWLSSKAADVVSQKARPRVPTRRIAAAAAALVLAVTAGGVVAIGLAAGDDPGERPSATMTELALAAETPSMSSCIPFSVESLAPMPMAFSGEVTQRTGTYVLIDVDIWYRGGDTDQVKLLAPDLSQTSLGDLVDFRDGSRYLVTATDGTVNYCGFTALWSHEMADAFLTAFGRGQ